MNRWLGVYLLCIGWLACFPVSTLADGVPSAGFPVPQIDFNAHRQAVFNHLSKYAMRQRNTGATQLNLPFEMNASINTPYRGKFLLIHGLSDSPYVWRDTAIELSRRGFDVRAILLPGHGSSPVNMLTVSYKQWLKAARQHLKTWQIDETPMYLGGFSLGGVLATVLALENSDIDGLLLFSPAYHSKLNSYLRWAWLYAKFKPWLFGGMIIEDNPIKYNSIPINSGTQFFNSSRYLKRRWANQELDIPTLMVVTEDDSVVDINDARDRFAERFISPASQLILYSADNQRQTRDREILRFSAAPDKRILNQSHLSLMNAPDNPLFGESHKVLICNGNEYPVFMACLNSSQHWYGAQHTASPDGVAVARTTYNPDFDFIFRTFDRVFTPAIQ